MQHYIFLACTIVVMVVLILNIISIAKCTRKLCLTAETRCDSYKAILQFILYFIITGLFLWFGVYIIEHLIIKIT
jgi:hypothetical protein